MWASMKILPEIPTVELSAQVKLTFDWPSAVLTLFLSRNANLLRASHRVARERTRTGLSSFSFSLRMEVSLYRHMSALDS